MVKSKDFPLSTLVALVVVVLTTTTSDAFTTTPNNGVGRKSVTALNVAPPMIIGPMLRKMREEQEKKKMPMASEDEQKGQAKGLRVGGSAWKWPPVWPYDVNFFTPTEDIAKPPQTSQFTEMAGMLSGQPQVPTPAAEVPEVEKLDVVKYWSEEKAEVTTDMDEDAKAELTRHLSFYLKDGMSILELGAAEDSYLPANLTLSRHVGVGLNKKLMERNPSLTDSLIVNLNEAIEGADVDSDELRKLASEPFDAIIMTNTVDFLTHPREVFRSCWYLLKPGGTMFIAFSSKLAYKEKFERAQTKMWRDFNDDQHMWICGSFFHFSAGDGWTKLLGFDISPESAKDALSGGPFSQFKQGKDNNLYVVQASRNIEDAEIDPENPEKSISSKMWMLPTMEDRDKKLVVPRLARVFSTTTNEDTKQAILNNISKLPVIYEALIKMDQFTFTFQMQSQLATDLVCNPSFKGNDEQIRALKEGLGLRTPSKEFWVPVGETTAQMEIIDKINLLAYLVPRFGSGNSDQDDALLAFATGLQPTFALIRSKCPDLSEADVQLLGTELLAAEILVPGRSTREEFASWVGGMEVNELKDLLNARKAFNESAMKDLEEYRQKQEEEAARIAELQQKYQEQVKKAREERSMRFNPQTGKMEEIKDKK